MMLLVLKYNKDHLFHWGFNALVWYIQFEEGAHG